MASKFIPTHLLIILVLISLLFIRESYAIDANVKSLNQIGHRKMLSGLKDEKTILQVSHQVSPSIIKDGSKIFRELKTAPSCPNPLHNCYIESAGFGPEGQMADPSSLNPRH